MFDVMVSAGGEEIGRRIAEALRAARMRVIPIARASDVSAASAFDVDVGVACANERDVAVTTVASMRAALPGPPPVVAIVPRIVGPEVRAAGAVDVLPEHTQDEVIVLRVQRAATTAERDAARIVLRGKLDQMPLGAIIEVMARRWEVFHVRVKSASRRGEASFKRGVLIHARVDGASGEAAPSAFHTFADGEFEVLAEGHPMAPPSEIAGDSSAERAVSTGVHRTASDWTDGMSQAGKAAAIVNALAAYARVWLPPRVVASVLRASYAASTRAVSDAPRFVVSDEAMATLEGTPSAKSVDALISAWVPDFLARCESLAPDRFQRDRLPDVLGSLRAMAESSGWSIDFAAPATQVSR